MDPQEFNDAGPKKLSDAETAALNRWLSLHVVSLAEWLENVAAEEQLARPQVVQGADRGRVFTASGSTCRTVLARKKFLAFFFGRLSLNENGLSLRSFWCQHSHNTAIAKHCSVLRHKEVTLLWKFCAIPAQLYRSGLWWGQTRQRWGCSKPPAERPS